MERQNLLRALGAKVVLTEGALGVGGSVAAAERLLCRCVVVDVCSEALALLLDPPRCGEDTFVS